MRGSFYKKLMASYLVVITVAWAAGLVYLHFGLSAQLMDQAREDLARNARLARRQLAALPPGEAWRARMNELVDEIGRALGLRVTVVSPAGRLLADSGLALEGGPGGRQAPCAARGRRGGETGNRRECAPQPRGRAGICSTWPCG